MQTSENSIIHLYFIIVTRIHSALNVVKYKFVTLWLNTTINSSTLSGLFHLI